MNSYDGSRIEEMNNILNFMYQMANKGPVSHNEIYNVLKYYGLKSSDLVKTAGNYTILEGLDNSKEFDHWIKRYANKKNLDVFVKSDWTDFCCFYNGLSHNENSFIKLYIPIDHNHLEKGADVLFDYLRKNNIIHQSKISRVVRKDNVIVRLKATDFTTAQKIIDFVNRIPSIKKGLNKPNPFVPTINGIGYMIEHGNSYNSDITDYLVDFINKSKKMGRPNITATQFREYLLDCRDRNIYFNKDYDKFDESMLSIFDCAYYGKNKNLNANNRPKLTEEQKLDLFLKAIKATYDKYGFEHIKAAILKIINYNDYQSITNDGNETKYREKLREYVQREDIIYFINKVNKVKNDMSFRTMNDAVQAFCIEMVGDSLPFDLDEICEVTLTNHGDELLLRSLRDYIKDGYVKGFSRFKNGNTEINYRNKMGMFNKDTIISIIIQSLENKGIAARSYPVDSLCELYVNTLSRGRIIYPNEAQTL